ncbi:hypothetical protein GCM10007209_06700 [Haloferax sulfurifontis]|uniref:Uncharacterized protein n=3 Tax=Haloferax TaxID=2251 RepID=A0A830DSG0_9EURY|nr:hypothetical protein GCM10007209_06700 [Haloferax sulfurifontis]
MSYSVVRTCPSEPPAIMTKHTYKTVYYADGWFEIREEENAEAWIATDAPCGLAP